MFNAGAMRLHSDGIDAGIRPATACHLFQTLENVHVLVIDRLCATIICCFSEAEDDPVDCDHSLGSQHERTFQREQPHWAASPYPDGIAGLNIAVLGGHIS